jgi:hypothetical protein
MTNSGKGRVRPPYYFSRYKLENKSRQGEAEPSEEGSSHCSRSPVASVPTAWRVVERLAQAGEDGLAGLRAARAQDRARAWQAGAAPAGRWILDIDATRRLILRLPAVWPWAAALATAFARLWTLLPTPG